MNSSEETMIIVQEKEKVFVVPMNSGKLAVVCLWTWLMSCEHFVN